MITYYVSFLKGSDTNPGTEKNPFKTMKRVEDLAEAETTRTNRSRERLH